MIDTQIVSSTKPIRSSCKEIADEKLQKVVEILYKLRKFEIILKAKVLLIQTSAEI